MALGILTADQLPAYLGCETTHVNSLASHHQLPAIRYGSSWRFPIASLNEYFNDQAIKHLQNPDPSAGNTTLPRRGRPPKPPADLSKTVQVAVPLPGGGFRRIR